MPPVSDGNKALWMLVESVLAAGIGLCVLLLVNVRTGQKSLSDRVATLEIRMAADEADEFTAQDALSVWQAIAANAKAASEINPNVEREFTRIDGRIDRLATRIDSE